MKQAVAIAGGQKLEHYCIAAWGTVKAIAREMGAEELVEAMQEALDKGYAWDRVMTELAESGINSEAIEAEEMEDGEETRQGQGRGASQQRSQGGQSERQQSGRRAQSAKGSSKSEGQETGGKSQSARSSSGRSDGSDAQASGESQGAKGGSRQGGSEQDDSDLKSREYRDKDGNIHHHTRSYMERQSKSK